MNPQFSLWLDMIRSDQMTARQVELFLADHPDFARWYCALISEGK